jgi:hypothetical protein
MLRKVLILSVIAGLFAWPYFSLLPVYGTRYLGVGERGVALLISAFGFGAVTGGIWASRSPSWTAPLGRSSAGSPASRQGGRGDLAPILVPFAIFGVGLGVLGLLPHLGMASLALFTMGIAQSSFLNAMGTQVQWLAPAHLRGRANAIYLTAILGLLPFGNLASGEFAQQLGYQGPRWMIALNGAAMATAAFLIALLNRNRSHPNSS